MEVVPVSGGGTAQLPFQTRNVQEWSRLDRLTGMLEHARVETDQWAANTASSTRKYGKVVDSRARNLADGSVQQRQRKQLEVFQAQVPGGSLQVIRTQSVTSTSSSTNWRSASSGTPHNFDNLQLSVNPLDLGPQKNKASVGRKGSIGSRRPPSRPRSFISKSDNPISEENTLDNANTQNINSRLSQVNRICQKIHEETKKRTLNSSSNIFNSPERTFQDELEIEVSTPTIQQIEGNSTEEDHGSGVEIEELCDDDSPDVSLNQCTSDNHLKFNGSLHHIVSRKRSSSTEDINKTSLEIKGQTKDTNDQDLDWRRASHIRRSLQFPPKATQENSTVSPKQNESIQLHQEFLDNRVQENNVLRGYEALENVFRRGANIADSVNRSMTYDKESSTGNLLSESLANHLRNETMNRQPSNVFSEEGFSRRTSNTNNGQQNKRHSFVTVESLKEVRGRLRRLSSPTPSDDLLQDGVKGITKDTEEHDDGIVTEDMGRNTESDENIDTVIPTSCVRSYVFGMEASTNSSRNPGCKLVAGTGSLESRTSSKSSGSSGSRSEEWYNRRKSYGFEQVHSHESDDQTRSIKYRAKNKVESSTDSGICRSSETVSVPVWSRAAHNNDDEVDICNKGISNDHPHGNDSVLKVSHSIQIKKKQEELVEGRKKLLDTNDSKSDDIGLQKGRRTVVTLGNELSPRNMGYKACDDNTIVVHNSITNHPSLITNGFRNVADDETGRRKLGNSSSSTIDARRSSEPITITIPIVSEDKDDNSSNVESKRLFFRQLSEGSSLCIENSQDKPTTILNGSVHRENTSLSRSNSQVAYKRGAWNVGDEWTTTSKILDNETKRHSIAVDELKYVREGLRSYSSVHNVGNRNNFEKELSSVSTSELVKRFDLNSLKQVDSFANQENGPVSSPGINVSFIQNGEMLHSTEENLEEKSKKQKKVEFSKTEIHFAAESGRFNIVETDEKPPPSNLFRRRRRNPNANVQNNQTTDSGKNNLPEVRFGDSLYEKKLLGGNENSENMKTLDSVAKVSVPPEITKPEMSRAMILAMSKFQGDIDKEDQTYTQANATIITTMNREASIVRSYEHDSQDCNDHQVELMNTGGIAQNEQQPRSILKNNRKPRPFLLGENNDLALDHDENIGDEQEEKWGVRLRPVQSNKEPSAAMWRSTVTFRNTAFENSQQQPDVKGDGELDNSSGGEREFQKLLRSLRPATQRSLNSENNTPGSPKSPKSSPIFSKKNTADSTKNGMQVKITATTPESRHSLWSVADRIRQVEDLKHASMETKGYSTRINFGGGEATVVESGSSDDQQDSPCKQSGISSSSSLFQQNDQPKQMWPPKEERIQDSVITHGNSNSEGISSESHQLSVATAMLPSYDHNRLRTVETLVSTRSGQPKITSISLRYEGEDAMDNEKRNYNDTQEVTRLANRHSTFTYASQGQSDSNISLIQDKDHTTSYLKGRETQFQHGSEDKASSTYQKVKQSYNSPKDDAYKDGDNVCVRMYGLEKKHIYEAERQERETNQVKDKSFSRQAYEPDRQEKDTKQINDQSFSSARDENLVRGVSPATISSHPYSNTSSPVDRKSDHFLSKNSLPAALPVHSEKERTPSAIKNHQNVTPTYFGHSSDNLHNTNSVSDSSKFTRQNGLSKSESKQDSTFKQIRQDQNACKRTSSKTTKTIKESAVSSDLEEVYMRSPQRSMTQAHSQEHGQHSYDKNKKPRSRSASQGRERSPNKASFGTDYTKSRKLFEQKNKRDGCESPIYENRDAFSHDHKMKVVKQSTKEAGETDSTTLEELTRAADQILQAVNGYTDDESNRASSEEDEHNRRHRRGKSIQVKRSSGSLGTISETPSPRKQKDGVMTGRTSSDVQKIGGNERRSQKLSMTRVGQNSSTSSVESFTREVRRSSATLLKKERTSGVDDRSKRKLTNLSATAATKPGSRTARLLQRASSREMLLQTHASSSEDIMSGAEAENNRKSRAPRRSRTHNTNITKTASMTSVASSTKKTSPSPSVQQTSSPMATRTRKKDAVEVQKNKERHSSSGTKQRSSTAVEHSKSYSSRARDAHRTALEDEGHRRSNRRDGLEPKQRAGLDKVTGSSVAPLTTGRDKVDKNASGRHLVGNVNSSAVTRSSTLHVVAKKKPSSSRNDGVFLSKSSK